MPQDEFIPSEGQIYAWIEEVFGHGIRRPGYPADRWAEQWAQDQFKALGLEHVRAEPVEQLSWEPQVSSLTATSASGELIDVPCFQLPHSSSTEALDLELVPFDIDVPERVRGSASLYDVTLMRLPHALMEASFGSWSYDPDGSFVKGAHVQPFGREFQAVMEPSMAAGAAAFIGVLNGYPGDSYQYYVPYDAEARDLPGVWISASSGARLRRMLAEGAVRVRLAVRAESDKITCYNIVAELPGVDDEAVIVGSHHDGPWASAVEDSSGLALVMAQATYWSRVPREQRPHRMVFLLNSGHMAGGAGQRSFVASHRSELDQCVLQVHLEHAANEIVEKDGELGPTGDSEVRWWFTSRIPRLRAAVRGAITTEDLRRSLEVPPEAFGEKPTTDGADFHLAGVPLVHFLVAPFYLLMRWTRWTRSIARLLSR